MKKNYKLISFILILVLFCTGCGGDSMYDSEKDGYTTVTAVDGVSFDIVSSIVRNATAITNISEDMTFEIDQTYLYKDGEKEYFIFNINSLVFVCEKGTSFGFNSVSDKLSVLQNDSILGVWLDNPKKKLDYEDSEQNGVYKMIATVNAEVSITSELYNDFTGKMAFISNGTTEWTMFVGTVGKEYKELDDDMKDTLSYMAASFMTATVEEIATSEPEIVLGGENATEETETVLTEEISTENETESTTEIVSEEASSIEETESVTETSENNSEEEETSEEIETIVIAEIEETEEPQKEPTPTPTPEVQKKEEPDKKTVTKVKSNHIALNNQKKVERDDNTVYSVDIYNMLPLKKKAYASIYTSKGYENAVVKVDAIYTGEDAVNKIKKACDDGLVSYPYFTASDGCVWEVAHYSTDFSSCSEPGYLNVKLRGMDGENLRYRGISYTQRTYNIKIADNEYYCYYAVPNGCKEYSLECGDGTVENKESGKISAYYHIER